MSNEKLIFGILLGVTAGVALGVLLAPDKGSTTRAKLLQSKDDYLSIFEKKFNDLLDQFQRMKKNDSHDLQPDFVSINHSK